MLARLRAALERASRSSLTPALLALTLGVAAAAAYFIQELTLSHFDARAHLVVSRRVYDSLRPGWRQLGVVWLPLPHILNVLPVQYDWLYQTGLSAVALSVAGFTLAATSCWRLVYRGTASAAAAWAAFAIIAAQPDTLYLQATPMTEALLMGLCLLGVTETYVWVTRKGAGFPWLAGGALSLACLTRYEAWPVTAAALVLTLIALLRIDVSTLRAFARVAMLAVLPVAAIGAFMTMSRLATGAWFVSSGFFEPDAELYHRAGDVASAMFKGIRDVNGPIGTYLGIAALVITVITAARERRRAPVTVALALLLCTAVPAVAFWTGHPFRIRYMVLFTMALAPLSGLGAGLLRGRWRAGAALVIALTALFETPPFTGRSPIVIEAQRDAVARAQRRRVTECLATHYDQAPILASMGSLAPYMQDTSRAGFSLRQFIHEGTGQLWIDSLASADAHAGWVLLDEDNAFRDALVRRRETNAAFLDGFERFCGGGGLVLYRRLGS